MTRFIGRSAELQRLRRVLRKRGGLVTLVGPPGVGKTRLARELLAGDDAGWFCDLSPATGSLAVATAVAAALDVPLRAGSAERAVERIAAALAERAGWLVLDNAEQVAADVADVARAWAEAAPRVRVLATSRVRLGADGEVAVEIDPLSHDDAVALFADRAGDARSEYRASPPEGEAVDEIVDRLDRMPLAIELAAARMRVLGAGQIRDRLRAELDVLVRGAGSASRWPTLDAAIEWSWELLDDAERAALAQAAAFRGGFDVDAAEAVIELPGGGVLDALHALCEHSLLRAEPLADEPDRLRFTMLASIRAFAGARRADADALHARHAAHYVARGRAWADRVERGDRGEHYRALVREEPNLLAAHERALARGDVAAALWAAICLDPLLQLRGDSETRLRLLDASLGGGPIDELEPDLAARGLLARAPAQRRVGRPEAERADLLLARAFAERAGDAGLVVRADYLLALHDYYMGRFRESIEQFEQVRRDVGELGDRHLEARVLVSFGNAAGDAGDVDRCRALLEESHAAFEESGDEHRAAIALMNLADVNIMTGRLSDARWQLERAQQRLHDIDRTSSAIVGVNLALIEQEEGRLDEAAELLDRSAQTLRSLGESAEEAPVLVERTTVLFEARRLPEARACLDRARAVAPSRGARGEALRCALLGAIEATEDHVDAADAAFRSARTLLEGVGAEADRAVAALHEGHLDLARARAAAAAGDEDAATRAREAALGRIERYATDALAATFQPVRLAARMLRDAAARAEPVGEALVVEASGSWFQQPRGERVDMRRRGAVRRILAVLAARRLEAPGKAVAVDALLEAGWPGEHIQHEAAVKRVYTAAWTLRKLGLGDVVVSRDGGYLLDPEVPLRRAPDASAAQIQDS